MTKLKFIIEMKNCKLLLMSAFLIFVFYSCNKEKKIDDVEPSINLAIDSIVATKTTLDVWEESYITVYAKGDSLTYKWSTNHGSMQSISPSTVKYWGCPSCVGLNIVECKVTNNFGTVSDTIMINVKRQEL